MTRPPKLSRASVLAIATNAATTRAKPVPHEHNMQVAFFKLVDMHPIYRTAAIYAVPNAGGYTGGFKSNAARAARMKAEGVRRGPPDINVDHAAGGYHGLRIELKHGKNKPTPEQAEWHQRLRHANYKVEVAYSSGQAWEMLNAYFGRTV